MPSHTASTALGAGKPENLTGQMVEGAEILYDHSTETTRWIVWRHPKTRKLSLLIAQGKDGVSVNITNVVYFVAKILPTLGVAFRLEKDAAGPATKEPK